MKPIKTVFDYYEEEVRKELENVSDVTPDESEELFREPEQETNSELNEIKEENENGNS